MSAARVPRVSIIVPSFDHGPFVLGAVRSVLDQTEPDVEVLVIDDGSTDDSLARLATVDDPRVTVLRHPNRGLSRTLNRGLQFARARWVKFLPSDDMLAPACIERELAAIEDPDVGVVFCLPEVVDAYGHPLEDPAPQAWFDTAARDDRSILPGLVERNFLCAPGALFDRELARELGGFDPDMKVAQDYDLWLRLLVRRRARLVPERLVRVRWHGANQSAVATPSTEAERARALVRAVAPGSRGDWIRRFAGGVVGRRGEALGRRAFAGALRRSGVPGVLPLATEMERCADELARGGPAARVARVVGSGLRGAVGLARRRLRPRWMRGVEGGRRITGAASTAGARVATIEPGRFAPASPDVADASGRVPRWIVLDPSPVPVGASTRAARLADALAARGASVVLATTDAAAGGDAVGGDALGHALARARRVPWSLDAVRAELAATPGRAIVLVGAPHPLAIAFAREARAGGVRVVYDRARAWEAATELPWRDPEGERALVALADDVTAAGRDLVGPLAGAGRVVQLLVTPVEEGAGSGFGPLADALLHATRNPTVSVLAVARPDDAVRAIESLSAVASRSREVALRPLLVLDASSPGSHEQVEEIGAIADRARVALLRSPVGGESAARRLGLRAGASEVVVFAAIVEAAGLSPGDVERAVSTLDADPTVGAVEIGAVAGAPGPDPTGRIEPVAPVEDHGDEFPAGPGGAVLACSRRAIERSGLPDPGPADRVGADRMLVRRLRDAGYRVLRLAS